MTWNELGDGVRVEGFRIDHAVERLGEAGDLRKPVLAKTKRVDPKKIVVAKKSR